MADSLLSELKTVPAAQFEAIDESSLMVDPNSAATSRGCAANAAARPCSPTHTASHYWSSTLPLRSCACACPEKIAPSPAAARLTR